jgi:hypothetical protein
MDSQDNVLENIAKLQEEYYNKNQKNVFFKKSQKTECATIIANAIDKNTLFNKTLFIIPEKKIIYFDYTIFKTYMNMELFDEFLDYEYNLTHDWVNSIPSYELHLNVKSLSISAFERYRGFIDKVLQRYPPISPTAIKMSKLYVYYTPSIIEQIMRFLGPFIQHLRDKIVFYPKENSEEYLEGLLNI